MLNSKQSKHPLIDIVLPVYNGSKFIIQQLTSLAEQSFKDFRVIIRDESEDDSCLELIKEFIKTSSIDILILTSDEHYGTIHNVNIMLAESKAPYVMFCDQDDAWLPDKIDKSLKAMQSAELSYGKNHPLLVYTDLIVTNDKLNVVSNSYYKYQNIDPANNSLNRLLLQNVASGCTMLLNRSLIDIAGEIPRQAVMHDHWYNLVASFFGKMIFIDQATLYYRQHENNFYGASSYGWGYFFKRYKTGLNNVRERLYQNIEQAEAFLNKFRESLPDETISMLTELIDVQNKGWYGRRKTLIKHKIFKSGWRRTLGALLII